MRKILLMVAAVSPLLSQCSLKMWVAVKAARRGVAGGLHEEFQILSPDNYMDSMRAFVPVPVSGPTKVAATSSQVPTTVLHMKL